MEVWSRSGFARAVNFHYLYHSFHFAEVRIFRPVWSIRESVLKNDVRCPV
jgi:hypothetical protein